ncbi:hypothetical protein C8A00DRAFT_47666 [Chaetomidium leptoderma]|uniref:Tetratricopeptide repeat protein n=1 Tax=Chaetomidium leptoderma TaxID=669021 RepID=A0AAN6ZQW7_9PEZI|nr:hypothetical protein C8A00DRAFT_47666 [Chaetomidium leptoderma]
MSRDKGRLNNLGNKLESRYERTGAMADLEEAIGVARQAVAATPDDHPNRAVCLNNLGTQLGRRYERTGAMADLEEAIGVARQAVAATPDNYPDRAVYRYKRTRAMADLDNASVPFRRVQAAVRYIKLLAVRGNISIAAQLGQDVIHLLPALNTKLLDQEGRAIILIWNYLDIARWYEGLRDEVNAPLRSLEYNA